MTRLLPVGQGHKGGAFGVLHRARGRPPLHRFGRSVLDFGGRWTTDRQLGRDLMPFRSVARSAKGQAYAATQVKRVD